MIHKTNTSRFIELDLLRGLALMIMVLAHILWDLDYYKLVPLNKQVYSIFQDITPNLFFILIGMCVIVSLKKKTFQNLTEENNYYKHTVFRGLKIFCLGILLTEATMIFIPEKPIMFGVLHCIGLSLVLSVPFLKYRNYNVLFSMIFISLGIILNQIIVEKPTILHLAIGLHQEGTWKYTLDYFPLFPWFGICLLGVVLGDWLYCGDKRAFKFPDLSKYRPAKLFSWIGQHSLGIYLAHQPVIAGVLILYRMI